MTAATTTVNTRVSSHGTPRLRFSGVLRSEWTKLWSLRSSVITLAVGFVGTIGFAILTSSVLSANWDSMSPQDHVAVGSPLGLVLSGRSFGMLAIAALGVLLFSGEYSTGMIRSSLTATPRRLWVLAAKAIVYFVVTTVLMAIALFASFFIGMAILDHTGIALGLGDTDVLRVILTSIAYVVGIGLLGVAMGSLIRNAAGGIAILLGVLLVVPGLLQLLPRDTVEIINPYLPSSAGEAMFATGTNDMMLEPWAGAVVFVGYIVVLLGVAGWLLRRRDA